MSDQNLWHGARRVAPSVTPKSAVLLLHGLGSSADDLIELAPYMAPALPHTVFISPNAPQPCDMAPMGYQWFSLQQRSPESMWQGAQQSTRQLMQMIEDVKAEFGLPANKIALLGFSQGTMMSLHVAPRLPEPLAAVVGIAGALVGPEHLATDIRSRPPVLLVHGQMDNVVPYEAMQMAQSVLQRNNVAVETLTRPRMAHNVDDETLTRATEFLSQHLGEG